MTVLSSRFPPQQGPRPAVGELKLPPSAEIVIIGAGVIGLSIAWRLAARGRRVIVAERRRVGAGASLAASGMLAATAEFEPGGLDLVPLALESQRLWPAFRAELEAAAAMPIDYREEGTLLVALSREELERTRFRQDLHIKAGLKSSWLSGSEIREREPGLRPSVVGGIYCPGDHQVDPRQVMTALGHAVRAAGGRIIEGLDVERLEFAGGRIAGIATRFGSIRSDCVIDATGPWSGAGLLPESVRPPIRPLKGQSLALCMSRTPELAHVVWTENVHLAPKSDGRLVVGATVEETGFDERVTAGGVYALLEGALRALPGVEELEIDAIWTGWRPTSNDDAPIMGPTQVDGLLIAAGHHRNGYLLAPVTAQALEQFIIDGEMPPVARSFRLSRFSHAGRQTVEEPSL